MSSDIRERLERIKAAFERRELDWNDIEYLLTQLAAERAAREAADRMLADEVAEFDRLQAKLTEAEARLQQLEAWQPFETAPRDGTEVLLIAD